MAGKAEKHRGVDRDARLLPSSVSATDRRPSFALAWDSVADESRWHSSLCRPITAQVFGGTSAFTELCEAIAASGLEPLQYLDSVISESGLTWESELAVELTQLFYALFSLATTELLDLIHSTTAEHLSRRILQIQGAVKRDRHAPVFGRWGAYTRHATVCHGTLFAPKFRASFLSSYVAGIMMDECRHLKQSRLAREEFCKTKKPTMGKGDGPGGGGGGGDSKGCGGGGGEYNQGAAASSGG